jgi:small subunit ribosomal protein S13
MVRIAGVNLENDKRLANALSSIYGIGPTTAQKVIASCKIQGDPKVKELTDDEVERIRGFIDSSLSVEGDARLVVSRNIKRLKDIGTYRGVRHGLGLPVRGQRTKTNSRTKRGKRVTVGSGRKKAAAKT